MTTSTSTSNSTSCTWQQMFNMSNLTDISNNSDQVNAVGLGAPFLIPLYSLIFLLGVMGNLLVIVTLIQNRRMRTVTNVFLLNLAISDLLLGVFCMPFTLVGALLREFIFGEFMCKAVPYLQAVSVSVSAWTLVAISVERYFAICQPLNSRRWQTLSHAYKMIGVVWIMSLLSMIPIAILSQLLTVHSTGKLKCREAWPTDGGEKAFTIFLDAFLLLIPLLIVSLAYSCISFTLWKGIQFDLHDHKLEVGSTVSTKEEKFLLAKPFRVCRPPPKSSPYVPSFPVSNRCISLTEQDFRSVIRVNNVARTLAAKKRVIRMLFVMVLEFFVCWTPLYVVNTLSHFCPRAIYITLGHVGISLIHLLAYVSSCCNPITYCFMHRKFRDGFIAAFSCRRKSKWIYNRTSEMSENETSFYISPQSTFRRDVLFSRNDQRCDQFS